MVQLQQQVGNAAVQHLLSGPAVLTVSRQVPPAYTAPEPGLASPGGSLPPVGSTQPAVVLAGSTPQEQAADGFKQATPAALDQAWGLLFSRAMFDLLPMLEYLKGKGFWSVISADAGPRGGPLMVNAVFAVDLKTKGSPITKPELRDLIDRMAVMNPDQRKYVLQYVGKYVTLTVDGLDLDFSYVAGTTSASALKSVEEELVDTTMIMNLYLAAGADKSLTTKMEIDRRVVGEMGKQGMTATVAGTTSPSGVVTVTKTPMSKVQPIMKRNTEIHESVHQHHFADLQKKLGKDTPAYDAAVVDAKDYVPDEVNARRAERAFLTKVVAALKQLETMVK